MKKTIAILLTVLLALSLFACAKPAERCASPRSPARPGSGSRT